MKLSIPTPARTAIAVASLSFAIGLATPPLGAHPPDLVPARHEAGTETTIAHQPPVAYTAEELARIQPNEPNPYLAFLPAEAKPNWTYWRAKMAYDGDQRARALRRQGPVIEQVEAEGATTTGANDRPVYGEPIPGFGSRTGQTARARITGVVRPLPDPIDPGTPGDAIPTAPLAPIVAGTRVSIAGVIGDSPNGSGGSGTGDFDFFRVPLAAGQRLELLVRTPDPLADLNPILGVYATDGTLLAFNDNLPVDGFLETFDSYLALTADAAGDVFVVVGGQSKIDQNQDEEDMLPSDPFDPASGPGAGSEGDYQLTIALDTLDPDDRDFYRVTLRAGDVLGATLHGDARRVSIARLDGTALIESRVDASGVFPDASPLPGGGRATAAYVIDTAGTYAVGVRSADPLGIGPYTLELGVIRAALDQEPLPASQTFFLDFDGARFDGAVLNLPPGPITLSPLAEYLDGWGLGPSDEDAVIDAVLAVVERQLDQDIRALGRNGDFAASGAVGTFDVTIRNSRDHPDPGEDPRVSRIVIGGSIAQLGTSTIGLAQSIDPGNVATAETAVVLLDLLSVADPENPNSLNGIPRAPGIHILAVIGAGVGTIASHEAGHMVANFHTRRDVGPPTVMDRGGDLRGFLGLGPDGTFGTDDDLRVAFALDGYTPVEGLSGDENTLDAVSFDLPRGGPRPDLALDALALDFGPIPVGSQRTLDLRVSNEGSQPLSGRVVLDPSPRPGDGAGRFSIEAGAGPFSLGPGDVRIATVRFEATALGFATAVLTIRSNDGDQGVVAVPLNGQGGVPMASASPTQIDFGDLVYGDPDTAIVRTVTVANAGPGDLVVEGLDRIGIDASSFLIAPDATPFTIAAGGARDVEVRFQPGGLVGPMQAILRVRDNDPLPAIDVPLFGVALGPDIDVQPSPFAFAVTRVGEFRERTFTVTNLGSLPLTVDEAILRGKDADAFAVVAGAPPFALDAGESHTFDVRFAPTEVGDFDVALRLLGNDPDESPFTLRLLGLGVLPQASVDPVAIDFGDVGIGVTRFRFLDITNDGNGRLFVQPPQITGPDADRFSLNVGSLFFVEPNETFRLLARFTPIAVGDFAATVQLETDDPLNPVFTIPVAGAGVAPALHLEKTCTGPDQPTCTLTVFNLGPGEATGVVVVDELPSAVAWTGDDCGAGPPAGTTWTWTVGTLAENAGATCTLALEAVDTTAVDVINTAFARSDWTAPGDEAQASAVLPLRPITAIPALGPLGTAGWILALLALSLTRLRRT